MGTMLNIAVEGYLRAKTLARGTRNEYCSTVRKWDEWGAGSTIEDLRRKDIRDFLDWVYQRAVEQQGTNPGRTANKAREHLRAVVSWAWEQEMIDTPPRFPKPREQRDVAGRHYLTKAEINAVVPRADSLEACILGPAVTRPGGEGAITVGVAVLPPGEDGQGVLPADEPSRLAPGRGLEHDPKPNKVLQPTGSARRHLKAQRLRGRPAG